MAKIFLCILLAASIAICFGCIGTDDPRRGGLFSYNPRAYKKRQAQRRERLAELEKEEEATRQRSGELEEEAAQKRGEKDALAEKLADLDQDIAYLEEVVSDTQAKTKKQQEKLLQLKAQVKTVKRKLTKIKSESSIDSEARKKEIERLKKKIDDLFEEAEALSRM
jgi:chromosome segregation ATPase